MESLGRSCITHSPQETISLGEKLGKCLEGGEFILLRGPLGVGKTIFVKGIARGLKVPSSVYVRSPSFTLLHIYQGRLPLYHFDLFRMKNAGDLTSIGWDEYLSGEGVVVVEWGDRFPDYLPSYLSIKLDFVEKDDERKILVQSSDKRYALLIERMFP